MLEKINALLKEKDTCVLSTVSQNSSPHCSLMAFATDEKYREIYMATPRRTKKYRNLQQNPAVSLLIDSRGSAASLQNVQALTVRGLFEPLPDENKQASAEGRLLERHPHLKSFIENPKNEVICIRVQSFQLLDGLTESHYIDLEKE